MKKTYVIDTNVFIQSPYAIECFEDNDLVIPLVVVEELDGLKKADGEKGANARAAVRLLENHRQSGDLLEGVRLPGGGTLRIEKNFANVSFPEDLPEDMTPNQVKGIITRAGKGTKIVLLGDPKQIDKPFLDERTNGLSYAAKYMWGSPFCWQITLSADECERSELALDAVKRLNM